MKILQINKFKDVRGGSETHFLSLIDLLKANGHDVQVFTGEDFGALDFNKKEGWLKDLRKAWNVLWSAKAARALEDLIRQDRPDVAHLHNFAFQLSPSIIWMLKKYQIPIVWTMHDYKLICPNYSLYTQGAVCQRCKVYKYYNCVKYRCLKNSIAKSVIAALEMYIHRLILKSYDKIDVLIAPSVFLKNICQEWGIKPEKIKLLRYFLDFSEYQPNFNPGDYVLYFGRLAPEKGLLDLMAAAQKLPGVKFKIAGRGPLEKQLSDLNLPNVEILGFKQGSELKDLIRNSAVVVVPSRWYDNNPFAVFESMALGKPVIGSDKGGIPELISDGQTGFIFESGNIEQLAEKIQTALKSDLNIMGQQARAFTEKTFSPHAYYDEIIKIYDSLVS